MRKNEIYRIKEYEDPKRALSKNARVLEQERDLSSLKKLQSLATVLSIITVVGGIGGVLFHSINILGGTGILVSVASLFLCLWKPAYCSLYGEEAYGVPMVSVEGPLFFSTLMLTFLATMLVNYVSYARLLGFRKDNAKLLTAMSKESSLPVLTKMSEIDDLPELGQKMLRHDMLASNLYTSVVTDKFKTAFQNEYKQGVLKV